MNYTRYFWWETGYSVSPYLVRLNPDQTVDGYIEPQHRGRPEYGIVGAGGWVKRKESARYFTSHGDYIKEISEAEARKRRPDAFPSQTMKWDGKMLAPLNDDYEYFTNDTDVYRRRPSAPDVFIYWSDWSEGWDDPCTPAEDIVRMRKITAEKVLELFPDAQLEDGDDLRPADDTLTVSVPLVDKMTIEYKYKGFGIEIAVVKLP